MTTNQKKPLKKVQAKEEKPLAKAKANFGNPQQTVWKKLHRTVAKKGMQRAYIQGTTEENPKKKLIVEVSKSMTENFEAVINRIMEELKAKNLTKEKALALRDELCAR